MTRQFMRRTAFFVIVVLLAGCAVVAKHRLDEIYGPQMVVDRSIGAPTINLSSSDEPQKVPEYYRDVKTIIDSRCAVCHECYDAPY